jgi:hypothetical protein
MATTEELLAAAAEAARQGKPQIAANLIRAARAAGAAPTGPATPPRAYGANGMAATPTRPQPNRFGDVTGEMMAPSVDMARRFGAGLADPAQSPTAAALPGWVPGAVRPVAAAAGDLGMAGLGVAGAGIAGAAGLIGEAVGGNRMQERKLAGDLLGMAQVAVPELAGVSSTARVAGAAAKAPAQMTAGQRAARAAGDLGITPTAAMGSKTGAMAAAALEKVPGAGEIIARDAIRLVQEVEGAFNTIRAPLGKPMGAADAGSALVAGLKGYVERFGAKAETLFDAVGQKLPGDTKVRPVATVRAIDASKEAFAKNPELAAKLGLTQWDKVAAEMAANGLNWRATREFRSAVGRAIGRENGILGDDDMGRLKSLYAALTADMESAAKAAGPDALAAWERANNFYRTGAQRIEAQLDRTIKGGDPAKGGNPERAFEAFDAMNKADRASSDVTRMRSIKASMKPGEWQQMAASVVDRLGRPKPGAAGADATFSPATFLTNWNKMTPEAKALLLPEDVRMELDKLAEVAGQAKAANLERNVSNTGTPVIAGMAGAGMMTAPVTTAVALTGANLTARAMTSTVFLRALNAARQGKANALRGMAGGNGPFASDAREVLRLMAADVAAAPANDQSPLRAAR